MKEDVEIHPTAIVGKGAQFGKGVKIGAYARIEGTVQLGDHVEVYSHGIVEGHTVIGARSRIGSFATVGTAPQDLKYAGEPTELRCGEDNFFREYCNISRGTATGGGRTTIGSNNLLMIHSHVAHDCVVNDHCVFANGVSLAGHVEIGYRVILGGHSAIHQFCKVGAYAMLGGGSILVQDVPPYVTVQGNHASPIGLNVIGLRRNGMTGARFDAIKRMYQLVYRENLTVEDALRAIAEEVAPSAEVDAFVTFIKNSKRGLCR